MNYNKDIKWTLFKTITKKEHLQKYENNMNKISFVEVFGIQEIIGSHNDHNKFK